MLGIGLRITNIINFASDFVKRLIGAFKTRVLADAGSFEAESCLNTVLTNLRAIDLYPTGDAKMIVLRTRALADGGTFESYNCGIITVQNLANINL